MRRIFLAMLCCGIAGAVLLPGCADLKQQGANATNPASAEVRVHPPDWNNPADTVQFHGAFLRKQNWDPASCRSCHGGMFAGGTSGVSCFTCHASAPHQQAFAQPRGHAGYVAAHGYLTGECKACHGDAYQGGALGVPTCSSAPCHATAGGVPKSPEACNTCHGSFRADPTVVASWAPPRTPAGDTAVTSPGVGAHQEHLAGESDLSSLQVPCNTCHVVPQAVSDPGHIQPNGIAVVTLGGFAVKTTGGITPAARYDYGTHQCSNTFCHGSWQLTKTGSPYQFVYTADTIAGGSFAPVWNGGDSQDRCGTCHGLPPQGHAVFSSGCSSCHDVFDAQGHLDGTKHINGKINVFGLELEFR